MNRPNNVSELLVAAAECLNVDDVDTERLEELKAVVEGWLQTDEERDAQLQLLDAMLEAAYTLEDL